MNNFKITIPKSGEKPLINSKPINDDLIDLFSMIDLDFDFEDENYEYYSISYENKEAVELFNLANSSDRNG